MLRESDRIEARFYHREDGALRCDLCYRRCLIRNGAAGFCGTRRNVDSVLQAITYGKPCCYGADPIEKKPFYHFAPGSTTFSLATAGCNFRCMHCQNYEISQAKPDDIPVQDLLPDAAVAHARARRCDGIAYTYTEPTVFYEYCHDIGTAARAAGLYNVFVTNGYATPEVVADSTAFLDAARIDLKGGEAHYRRLCSAQLEHVLESIRSFYKTGMHIEIITLIIPGENDDHDTITQLAQFIRGLSPDIPWHLTGFHPAYRMNDRGATSVSALERAHDWAVESGMRYVYAGNLPGHKYENTYCPRCNALLIERTGFAVATITLVRHGGEHRCPACGTTIPITDPRTDHGAGKN